MVMKHREIPSTPRVPYSNQGGGPGDETDVALCPRWGKGIIINFE